MSRFERERRGLVNFAFALTLKEVGGGADLCHAKQLTVLDTLPD
jgi:hypothetical protein